jgi:chromobox protein 1
VVEAIHGHRFQKGVLQFDVKWEGYDDPKDRTWETEDNMYADTASSSIAAD